MKSHYCLDLHFEISDEAGALVMFTVTAVSFSLNHLFKSSAGMFRMIVPCFLFSY